jgi:hypothetical protein
VTDIAVDRLGALLQERVGGVEQGAAGIDNVVHEDADAAVDLADDVRHFRFARPLAPLVDNGERRVDAFGEAARAHDTAHVRRDDHDIGKLEALLDVAHHHRGGKEIVGRNVEEPLDLSGVEIDRKHAVGPGVGYEIGDELRRNRRARPDFAVLPGIAEIGQHRRDAPRRGAPQRVDDDEQLHQVVVRRERGRLNDENVGAAHVFLDLDEDLHVGEAAHDRLGQRRADIGADALGEGGIGVAGNELDCSVVARHPTLLRARPDLIQAAYRAGNMNSGLVNSPREGPRW